MNGHFAGGNGDIKILEDMLVSYTEANMMRLKVMLLSFTKTAIEHKVIGFLCDGYRKQDIADVLKVSWQRVNNVTRIYRKRLTTKQIEDIFSILKES